MKKNNVFLIFLLISTFGCGKSSNSDSSSISADGKIIFITASSYTGDLGGKSGADDKCNSDANNPGDGSQYKALIGVNQVLPATARMACVGDCVSPGTESSDWPLTASTRYIRPDGTLIGTTDEFEKFDYLGNTTFSSDPTELVWTGLTSDANYTTSAYHCSNWTASSIQSGRGGNAAGTDGTFAAEFRYVLEWEVSVPCGSSRKLICVEI